MAIRYDEAEPEVYAMLAEVIREHFIMLDNLKPMLTFTVQMAVNEKKPGRPALKRYGHVCAGRIEVIKSEERAVGGQDLRIKIDSSRWAKLDGESRKALLFHECMHIELKYDRKTGELKLDPYGRPEIGLCPDDWMLTGFKRTVEVFGEKALERQAIDSVEKILGQKVLPFMKADVTQEPVTADEVEKPKRRKAAN